jgi:hypothetical protein
MGKGPLLPDSAIKKARRANRKIIKAHKDLNAAVRAEIKAAGKPTDADERRQFNRNAFAKVIKRNPLLVKAVKENLAKARPRKRAP